MIYVIETGPLALNTCIVELSGSQALIIDPADCAFSGDEGKTVRFLQEKVLSPLAVILTHGHFDHVSGLKTLKKQFPHVPILIHKEDRAFIGKESAVMQKKSLEPMRFTEFLPFVSDLPEPTDFLEDKQTLATVRGITDALKNDSLAEKISKELNTWTVLHTPGHTRGSCCLFCPSHCNTPVLLSGDTVFFHSWGRTDLPSGSEKQIKHSLAFLYKTLPPETMVYPGHDEYGFIIEENYQL